MRIREEATLNDMADKDTTNLLVATAGPHPGKRKALRKRPRAAEDSDGAFEAVGLVARRLAGTLSFGTAPVRRRSRERRGLAGSPGRA